MRDGEFFNADLYRRIRAEREARGMPVMTLKTELKDHPLVGCVIRRRGQLQTIVGVYRMWHLGWYYALLTEHNGSHGVIEIDVEDLDKFDTEETLRKERKGSFTYSK